MDKSRYGILTLAVSHGFFIEQTQEVSAKILQGVKTELIQRLVVLPVLKLGVSNLQKLTQSSWKWFSYLNNKLEEQLLLTTFSIVFIYEKYLVKMC